MKTLEPGTPVGVVGLGAMGGAIARRVLDAGVDLAVHDIDSQRVEELVASGATAADLPQMMDQSAFVITCLPNSEHVRAVGDPVTGLLSGDVSGTVWIEMSTIDPAVTRDFAVACEERGGTMIDAAIGGYPSQALDGGLRLMVGASEDALRMAMPVIEVLSSAVVHCGDVGLGVSTKLVNNLLAQVTYMATCEAMLLGRAMGIDLGTMMSVFKLTDANTGHLRYRFPEKVAKRDFEAEFSIRLANKDARIAMEAAEQAGSPQLFGGILRQYQAAAVQAELEDADVSAMLLLAERLQGREL